MTFSGKACVGFGLQAVDPELRVLAGGGVETLPFFGVELVGLQ